MKILNPDALREKPRAILFDLDDTLYEYAGPHERAMAAVRSKVERSLKVVPSQFNHAFRQAREEVKRALGSTASSHNRLLYFQRMIELLGLNSQPAIALDLEQTYWRTLMTTARLHPGAEETLIELRAAGLPLGLVTDLTAQIQFRKLVYFGIDRYFDIVVTSEEAGVDKVGLKPFEVAAAKLELQPGDRIWFIGDAECDVVASKKVLNAATFQKLHPGASAQHVHDGVDATFHAFADFRDWARGIVASA
ncbi:hydrolase [Pseudoroseomonas rhizosphaerae]|uniref:Hydrolase n=1 Tax=Teichococcus rhizosphaerae TaxID=1335062 RepID=A0A2C6ZAC7_9PROT|nr:HAD family hydrolase [Pseudoroseomonas rhizosphaerae]PHK95461.1 hydrolase [Pseudoroseomonas rhizosphaerae]